MRSIPELVLASASPRRRQLLADYGFRARIQPADVEESNAEWLTVTELVILNATLKSAALWAAYPKAVVIGVDTLVCLDGKAIGKPVDHLDAADTLSRLSGRSHQVLSGVCLACPAAGRTIQFVEETIVTFRKLSPSQVASYLALIDPLDKAGAYAAQEHGELIIASTAGSWTNVLGLPMERFVRTLAENFDVHPAPLATSKSSEAGSTDATRLG